MPEPPDSPIYLPKVCSSTASNGHSIVAAHASRCLTALRDWQEKVKYSPPLETKSNRSKPRNPTLPICFHAHALFHHPSDPASPSFIHWTSTTQFECLLTQLQPGEGANVTSISNNLCTDSRVSPNDLEGILVLGGQPNDLMGLGILEW